MEGAQRVFAGEFNRTTASLPYPARPASVCVVTPGGAWCRSVFIAGALVEVEGNARDMMRARVADPTGAFELFVGREQTEAAASLKKLAPPLFITVLGAARISTRSGRSAVSVVPEDIRVTDRTVRDTWVLRTADLTILRLEAMRDEIFGLATHPEMAAAVRYYRTTALDLHEIAVMVESALASVRPVPAAPAAAPDAREAIIVILKGESGPRGITVNDLIARANEKGIATEDATRAVQALIEEDECYQPVKGMVKLL